MNKLSKSHELTRIEFLCIIIEIDTQSYEISEFVLVLIHMFDKK